jgi:hypothetical protein
MEVGMDMAFEYHRGANIDDIQDLDHMLLFAKGIGRNRGCIFEVNLPVDQRVGPLLRFWAVHGAGENPIVFAQDFPDGARRAGERHIKGLHLLSLRAENTGSFLVQAPAADGPVARPRMLTILASTSSGYVGNGARGREECPMITV